MCREKNGLVRNLSGQMRQIEDSRQTGPLPIIQDCMIQDVSKGIK